MVDRVIALCYLLAIISRVLFTRELSLKDASLSSEAIAHLYKCDRSLSKKMLRVLTNLKDDTLRDFLDFERLENDMIEPLLAEGLSDEKAIYHPINQFLILYKFNKIWPKLTRAILLVFGETLSSLQNDPELRQTILSILETIDSCKTPDADLSRSAIGLFRIQEIYDIDTEKMSSGILRGYGACRNLRLPEVEYLAQEASANADVCRSFLWSREVAIYRAQYFSGTSVSIEKVSPEIDSACRDVICGNGKGCAVIGRDAVKYRTLCRHPERSSQWRWKLKCEEWKNHPQFFWQPIRVEWLSRKPQVLRVVDLISEEEADLIWELSPKLERGKVLNSTGFWNFKDSRTGVTAWVTDRYHPTIRRISDRIGRLLNKNMEYSENYQVGNYGVGGHYFLHHDYLKNTSCQSCQLGKGFSNRLLTVVLYLSNVTEGGYTVFPKLSLAVKPQKGSALVFQNVDFNENPYPETLHAGCPVILGNKIFANKWINYAGQFLNSPCSLDG